MSCVCKELEAKQKEIEALKGAIEMCHPRLDGYAGAMVNKIEELTAELDRITKRCEFLAADRDRVIKLVEEERRLHAGQDDHIRRLEKRQADDVTERFICMWKAHMEYLQKMFEETLKNDKS